MLRHKLLEKEKAESKNFNKSIEPIISRLKHIFDVVLHGPVAAFSGSGLVPRQLDEALVEAEVVADGVLPALPVVLVVGEVLHDEGVDLAQGHFPVYKIQLC